MVFPPLSHSISMLHPHLHTSVGVCVFVCLRASEHGSERVCVCVCASPLIDDRLQPNHAATCDKYVNAKKISPPNRVSAKRQCKSYRNVKQKRESEERCNANKFFTFLLCARVCVCLVF